jgi:hypothetical protein
VHGQAAPGEWSGGRASASGHLSITNSLSAAGAGGLGGLLPDHGIISLGRGLA